MNKEDFKEIEKRTFVIAAVMPNGKKSYHSTDYASGYPYWTSTVSSAKVFASEGEAINGLPYIDRSRKEQEPKIFIVELISTVGEIKDVTDIDGAVADEKRRALDEEIARLQKEREQL